MSSTTDLSNLTSQTSQVYGTGGLGIPAGSRSQRPKEPTAGMLRWNTSASAIEYFGPSDWNEILNRSQIEDRFVEIANPSITGDMNANNNSIKNLKDPVDDKDAVNKVFLNTRLSSGVGINADQLGGHDPFYYATQFDVTDLQAAMATVQTNLNTHIADTNNPHQTTKDQIGLDQVDNTSDLNKPISTATQTALDSKVNRGGDVMLGPLSMGYQNLVDIANLVGMIAYFPFDAPPAGFLECNGAAVSRITYAKLFAKIGTRFGAGDGSTTFNLPDLRGMFVRGWSHGAATDPGRALGSFQDDDNKAHLHPLTDPGHVHSASAGSAGDHQHDISMNNVQSYDRDSHDMYPYAPGGTTKTGVAGAHTHPITVANGKTNITINSSGTEARPKNLAMLVCIMY